MSRLSWKTRSTMLQTDMGVIRCRRKQQIENLNGLYTTKNLFPEKYSPPIHQLGQIRLSRKIWLREVLFITYKVKDKHSTCRNKITTHLHVTKSTIQNYKCLFYKKKTRVQVHSLTSRLLFTSHSLGIPFPCST